MSEEFYIQRVPPKHTVGDMLCKGCLSQHRATFLCECGGIIHEDYMGSNKTSVFVVSACDRCGDNRKPVYDARFDKFLKAKGILAQRLKGGE